MHNSELADVLGNLVHRVLNLTQKYCNGVVPDVSHDPAFALPFDLGALKAGVKEDMKLCALHLAQFKAMEAVRATNRYAADAGLCNATVQCRLLPYELHGACVIKTKPVLSVSNSIALLTGSSLRLSRGR
jgi:hypothetical protein